jgi:hypothetical protein
VISTTASRIEKYIVKGQVEGMVGVDMFQITIFSRISMVKIENNIPVASLPKF